MARHTYSEWHVEVGDIVTFHKDSRFTLVDNEYDRSFFRSEECQKFLLRQIGKVLAIIPERCPPASCRVEIRGLVFWVDSDNLLEKSLDPESDQKEFKSLSKLDPKFLEDKYREIQDQKRAQQVIDQNSREQLRLKELLEKYGLPSDWEGQGASTQ